MHALSETRFGRALANLGFSRSLAALLIANLVTLAVCNALRLPLRALLLVFPLALLAALRLTWAPFAKRQPLAITRGMVAVVACFAAGLALLRLPYALEWLPGNIVGVTWDDEQRIAGLISMTLSPDFPLRHFANQDYLYSYYYASMIPLACLKLAIPLLTLKDVLFLGNAFYLALVMFSVLEMANQLCPERRALWILVFLHTAFGGLDWLASILLTDARLVGHHEWWQAAPVLHGNAQLSSFCTALIWSFPHVLGFIAGPLAFVFLHRMRYRRGTVKLFAVGALLVAGFYSSVFAMLTVPLLLLPDARLLWRRAVAWRALPALALLALLLVLPAPLMMHRAGAIGFIPATFHVAFTAHHALDRALSLPLWFVLVTLVEFAWIPVLLLPLLRRAMRRERAYYAVALAALVATYFIAFTNFNNISMRAMLLPTFVFYVLFARHAPRAPAVARVLAAPAWRYAALLPLCALFAAGTLLEYAHDAVLATRCMALGQRLWPPERRYPFPVDYRALARDRSTTVHHPVQDAAMWYYNAEKWIENVPPERMARGELEQLRWPD